MQPFFYLSRNIDTRRPPVIINPRHNETACLRNRPLESAKKQKHTGAGDNDIQLLKYLTHNFIGTYNRDYFAKRTAWLFLILGLSTTL